MASLKGQKLKKHTCFFWGGGYFKAAWQAVRIAFIGGVYDERVSEQLRIHASRRQKNKKVSVVFSGLL